MQIISEDLKNSNYTKIHTRFPPEPNGYLHIGHAKSICLNFGLAKYYQGKCNLRFDDTNPEKEHVKFIESIKSDIKWLGFMWHGQVKYASDYFDILYEYAIKLINQGLAYVDELSPTEIKDYRGTLQSSGKNSPFRNRTIKENYLLFKKMTHGDFQEGRMCLRAKIDMSSPFMVLRDPVIYRIKFTKHHRTGTKWCIYPMYDFAHCICDYLEGITHSLCTLEFQDNRQLYEWILNHIAIPKHPKQYEFARLNIEYSIISKRKMVELINNQIVTSWDDPRMLTIAGLRRRGYTASSIRKFCKFIGVTKQESIISMSLLEYCIRTDLNNIVPRIMAVINPIKIIIENIPDDFNKTIIAPNHPNIIEMGTRKLIFSREIWIDRADFCEIANKKYKRLTLGHEVRLRYAYIIRAHHIIKNKMGMISCIYCTVDLNTLNKNPNDRPKPKGVIHWISTINAVSAEFRIYENLFNVPNPSIIKNFLDVVNHNSLKIKYGFIESSVHSREAQMINTYQFEREGYFCIDVIDSSCSHLVFNKIVGLKDNWQKLPNKD